MAKPKISVIVPIYNAEKYLVKCLNSIVSQTYENIEIILVNDGSTDSSRDMMNEYAARDNRIIAIDKENGGIGSAYEAAFQKMTGEYVSFVDSDDYIELNMYEELVQVADGSNADIVQFNMIKVDEDGNRIGIEEFGDINYNNMEQLFEDHYMKRFHPSLGCRIFKQGLLKNAKLLKQNIGIDELLITQAIIGCNKLVSVDKAFYYQFVRVSSVSRSSFNDRTIEQGINVYKLIFEITGEKNSKLAFYPLYKYLDYIIFAFSGMSQRKGSDLLRQEFSENFNRLKRMELWKQLSVATKARYSLFRLNPNLYIKLNQILKK